MERALDGDPVTVLLAVELDGAGIVRSSVFITPDLNDASAVRIKGDITVRRAGLDLKALNVEVAAKLWGSIAHNIARYLDRTARGTNLSVGAKTLNVKSSRKIVQRRHPARSKGLRLPPVGGVVSEDLTVTGNRSRNIVEVGKVSVETDGARTSDSAPSKTRPGSNAGYRAHLSTGSDAVEFSFVSRTHRTRSTNRSRRDTNVRSSPPRRSDRSRTRNGSDATARAAG